MSKKKKSILNFLEEETTDNKAKIDTSKFNVPFDIILKEIELYKEDFKLSDYYNVRLTNENYEQLKHLKVTNVSMMHLVNFIVKIVVETDSYQKYINKKE